MKTKQKPVKRPKEPRNPRKKLQFEDGVRAALIAGAVICAAVLGVGGFFAVRSVLAGGNKADISLLNGEAETPPKPEPVEESLIIPDSGTDILPELDAAIRDLEAAANAADTAQTGGDAIGIASASTASTQPQVAPDKPGQKGVLVLVIDDAGNNLKDLDPFLKFPGPITISVLPGLANSVEAARRVRAAGKELFLHQPMEPLNGQNPGPGSINAGISPAEVKEILVKNLNEIGPVTGFNNHEGSRATMEIAIMRPLLEVSRDSALVFLDSRTTADTVAPQIAKEMGVSIAERDIFLDNEQDRASILTALEAGCKKAELNGVAILIGHVWSPRLAAILIEMYPELIKRGFVFATVSSVTNRGK